MQKLLTLQKIGKWDRILCPYLLRWKYWHSVRMTWEIWVRAQVVSSVTASQKSNNMYRYRLGHFSSICTTYSIFTAYVVHIYVPYVCVICKTPSSPTVNVSPLHLDILNILPMLDHWSSVTWSAFVWYF